MCLTLEQLVPVVVLSEASNFVLHRHHAVLVLHLDDLVPLVVANQHYF